MAKNPFIATNYPGYDYSNSGIASVTGGASTLPPDLLNSTSGNLREALAGQLPQDTIDLIRQKAAEFGVGSGTSGSELAANQGLRTLGLTSLDQKNRATQSMLPFYISPLQFSQMQQRNASAPIYSGMPKEFAGSVTPPISQPHGGGGAPPAPMGSNAKTGSISDELIRYLNPTPPFKGGNTSPSADPFNDPNIYNPFYATPEAKTNDLGGVPMFGTFQSPKLDWNYDINAGYDSLPDWAYGAFTGDFGEGG